MTIEEYSRLKERIEVQYREDMAALERIWTLMTGTQAPDSPVVDGIPRNSGAVVLRSAEALGIPPAAQIDKMHRGPQKYKAKLKRLTEEEMKERRREYNKRYWAKRAKAGKPIAKRKFDALLLKKPVEANGAQE